MKFKALNSFVSGFGTFDADEVYDVRLDKPTSKMWIEHGLIEKVKVSEPTQESTQESTQEPVQDPTQEPTQEEITQETDQEPTEEPVQEPIQEVKPVETDENK